MVSLYIYFAVIVSGASVLAIEILGTRVIAPFYGAGLYLWSALISVTLAALSAGYALGGRWADRDPQLGRFASVLGIAGIWIALVPWLRQPVLALSEAAGLRTAVLVTSTILFFPPLLLLGMVSPYAIRLKAASLDVVGRTAGNLYAISTVASVVSALLTGFFLIPLIGVYRLLFMIGFLLVATASLGLIVQSKHRVALAAPLALAIIGVLVYRVAPAERVDPENGLLSITQSRFGEIRVVDYEGTRYMLLDGGTHTIVDPATWESYFPYVNVLDIPRQMFVRPGDMLLVGLGGGSIAKHYSNHHWFVDAVEIDPAVVRTAREFFGLRSDDAEVYEIDAREFLLTHANTYDLIIMDAFGSSAIPFHLVTSEAFALLKSRLITNGIVAMNIESVGWDDILVRSLAATAKQQFANVVVLPIAEPPDQLGNIILLASDRPLVLLEEIAAPLDRFSAEYDQTHAWDNQFIPEMAGVPILTDDRNPIALWADRINRVARERLHEYFPTPGLAW